jgi:predicted ATP-dependent endonuclease of OLD family
VNANQILDYIEFFKSNPRPEGKVTALGGGDTSFDEWYWKIIDKIDYPSDDNYKRISKLFDRMISFNAMSERDVKLLKSITEHKTSRLYSIVSKDITEYFSDDSWDDLSSYIVSKGKDFYNSVKENPEIINQMLKDISYSESFNYCFTDFI